MSDFGHFFRKSLRILFFFSDKKGLKEIQNFEMLKVDPKTANLAIVLNFEVIEKIDDGFGIRGLKLLKFV